MFGNFEGIIAIIVGLTVAIGARLMPRPAWLALAGRAEMQIKTPLEPTKGA
ncbi:hypothetical protein QTH90_19630 [Variovorax sp. J2P1-59]|uniref:hypothetical protein n=1 Tax=Variovorax flavidus TaxID=3053501 RepID=UPI0025767AD8|nr:hypothetical protein [Variovorax sp. J2P1-59]MDM0076630.1 hypothetical protein [Variovorax sp. J2P1-59]